MSLWEPGTIDGLTVAMIQRVAAAAYRDHCPPDDVPEWAADDPGYLADAETRRAGMLKPSDMEVNEVREPSGDQSFDRVSFAKWNDQTFWLGGREYRVTDYYGNPWTCEDVRSGERVRDFWEDVIARQLTSHNGPHPDPYIALVEVTYNTAGHRAGYGVRASGSCSCWYD